MQTQLKRLFSAILVLAMVFAWYVPSTVSAEDTTSELLFKEDFGLGSFSAGAWSSAAQGIAVSNATYVKAVWDGTNTAIHVNLPAESNTSSNDYNIDARFHTESTWSENKTFWEGYRGKSIVYQFKFKPAQTPTINVQLRYLADKSDAATRNTLSLFSIDANGTVQAFNRNISQAFETDMWYDIALVCDFTDGSAEIYINGTKVAGSFTIPVYSTLISDNAGLNPLLRFSDKGTSTKTTEYYLDDIAVYTGSAPVDQFAKTVRFSENFAPGFTTVTDGKGIQNASVKGLVSHFTESDGNHALKVDMGDVTVEGNSTFQINARYNPSGEWASDDSELYDVCGKTLIYQFMVKINTNANFNTALRTDDGGKTRLIVPIKVTDNVLMAGSSETEVATLTAGRWYSIAAAVVFPADGTSAIESHVYLDGEYKGNYSVRVDQNKLSNANYMVRFYSKSTNQDFLLDNIAVYEASGFDNEFFGGSFTGNNVTLNAKLGVNFYAKLNDGVTGTVKVSNVNGKTEPVSATRAAVDSNGDWKLTVNVLPQYMMEEMTAGLYGADGELIDADIFELSEYIAKVQANPDHAVYHELAAKTLQYCKAAAIHKDEHAEDGFSVAAVSPELESYADTLIEGATTSLVLDDACDLKIWIPGSLADKTLTIGGKEIGVVKDVCTLDTSDNTYGYVVATELLPQSYDNQYTVTIGDQTCMISALGWMQRYIPDNQDSTLINQLVWALYEYYAAANAIAS